jgi:pimeloyl-ACP methyl ester carboxylesterase
LVTRKSRKSTAAFAAKPWPTGDRLVDDVEALRAHLGRDRIDLLGHSAGGSLAMLYAARCPDRVNCLVLVNPSPFAVGLEITDLARRQVAELRREEAWLCFRRVRANLVWPGHGR